jgi:D-isomer specific 2-hydroxyacid dehydrogenase, NAD binding domain
MSLYTIDIQLPRKRAPHVLGIFERRSGVDVISTSLLYSDLRAAYYRLEIVANETLKSELESALSAEGDEIQCKFREELSMYRRPLVELSAARRIEFKKSFVTTAPAALRLAQETLYSAPGSLAQLSSERCLFLSDGAAFEARHLAAIELERDAYLAARNANVFAWPLWVDARNEEEFIKTAASLAPNVFALRLSRLQRETAVEIAERIQEALPIPVIHAEFAETALLMTAALQNAARLHNLELSGRTAAILGLGPAGHGLAKFLERMGLARIYGLDPDARQLTRFERGVGIASSLDHVAQNADFVIVTPEYPGKLDARIFRSEQLILSFAPAFDPDALDGPPAARWYQGAEPHPVFILPGLMGALQRSQEKTVTPQLLDRLLTTLTDRPGDSGFLPAPSQELFQSQWKAGDPD